MDYAISYFESFIVSVFIKGALHVSVSQLTQDDELDDAKRLKG